MKVYLSVDLGAGSGRVIAGKTDFSEGHSAREYLELEELHRFENNNAELPGGFYWDVIGIYRNILKGIRVGIDKYGDAVQSVGIDTWGCDYGLISKNGNMLGMPYQYRDTRSEGMAEEADRIIGNDKIYAQTGVSPAFYNTSLHLLAQMRSKSQALSEADRLLFISDLLAYWLTGKKATERTIASTSQLYSPATKDWAWEVIDGLGIPRRIFGNIHDPGTILGSTRSALEGKIGTKALTVVNSPQHDTASAVAGIPIGASSENQDAIDVWISSGTWSIMGVELDEPILTKEAQEAGFANETGVNNTIRFLKNISGLWMVQECRQWVGEEGEDYGYAALAQLASEAEPFTAFVDPDDPLFSTPGNMPEKIKEYCRNTGQPVPEKKGTILRIASESVALKYRVTFDQLAELVKANFGKELGKVYMGGGGIQNQMLTQNAADAIGREVVAGPIEATSCGNLITQMVALGDLPDIKAGRELILRSNEINHYHPEDADEWANQLERFKSIITKNTKHLTLC